MKLERLHVATHPGAIDFWLDGLQGVCIFALGIGRGGQPAARHWQIKQPRHGPRVGTVHHRRLSSLPSAVYLQQLRACKSCPTAQSMSIFLFSETYTTYAF